MRRRNHGKPEGKSASWYPSRMDHRLRALYYSWRVSHIHWLCFMDHMFALDKNVDLRHIDTPAGGVSGCKQQAQRGEPNLWSASFRGNTSQSRPLAWRRGLRCAKAAGRNPSRLRASAWFCDAPRFTPLDPHSVASWTSQYRTAWRIRRSVASSHPSA